MLEVNNQIYEELGNRWYLANDDPVALLRAESRLRNPWIDKKIQAHFGDELDKSQIKILDVGCGAGFLSNNLALKGYQIHGVDLSQSSIDVAAKFDETQKVRYTVGNARHLEFKDNCYDVVTAMDFLEHVEEPKKIIEEISRVIRPGGIFFFHTFNRNFISWLVAIKAVEFFVNNTPEHLHVLKNFIKPEELESYCAAANLEVHEFIGCRPVLDRLDHIQSFLKGVVPPDFSFQFTKSLKVGYSGYAVKIIRP